MCESRASASTTLSIIYDLPTIPSIDHPILQDVNRFLDLLVNYANPGNYLVEFFTWMKYIPSTLAKWKRDAEEGHRFYSDQFMAMFSEVEQRIVTSYSPVSPPAIHLIAISSQNQGDERPSFAGALIRERQRNHLNDWEAAWLAATM